MNTTVKIPAHDTAREETPFQSVVYFFRSWKKLGVFSWLHIQVIGFWLVLAVIGVGPLYLVERARDLEGYIMVPSQYRPEFIIVVLSYFVIILGNLLYLFDIYQQAAHVPPMHQRLRNTYFLSLLVCVGCIVVCAIGMDSLRRETDIDNIVDKTEHFTRTIFAGLLLADVLMLLAKDTEIGHARQRQAGDAELRDLRAERRFIFNQMILIDIPVLLGVLFISLFSDRVNATGFYFTTQGAFSTSKEAFQSFRNYFSVGAIGMHVIFSQFVFIMLNTRSLYRKIRQKS